MAHLFDENKGKQDFEALITPKLDALKTTFQGYVNSIYNKFVNQGTTPTTKTPAAISTAVDTLATNKYNAGVSATKKGNAGQGDVLSGKTFTNSSTVNASGTMVNRGAVSQSLNPNSSYTIPQGYHNGSGKVTAKAIQNATVNNSSFAWSIDPNDNIRWVGTYNTNHSTCFAAQIEIMGVEADELFSSNVQVSSGKIIVEVFANSSTAPLRINAKYFYY